MDQRVPKKLLLENGAPTAADKRHINDGIEELHWVAALKPTTIGVPEYRDDVREYLEIAVLRWRSAPPPRAVASWSWCTARCRIPCFCWRNMQSKLSVSLAHKRWSQGEAGKTVLDGDVVGIDLHGVD